ncbi:MAG: SusC/RagA family TonB-linked outer membrane protein [Ferruginibacter sp.]|nr:SusC/RagA family TonB-linked outer membrane protein [Ferruginibacter sp.]
MRKIAMLMGVLFFITVPIFAQNQVKGKVLDAEGSPIASVSVRIQGTNTGTSTKADGSFELPGQSGTVLEISNVGHLSQTVTYAGRELNIRLEKDTRALSEVVVTALGIKREKRQLTYSTQEVKGETVIQAKQDNLVNGLAGKVSGVQISNSSGMAGSSSRITIRGNVSLLQDNQPLFVIDGVPIDNSEPGGIDVFSQGANNTALSQGSTSNRAIDIDPSIIETITVLKGGAATALYGASAARGAILITTKTGGRSSKPVVSISSSLKFDEPFLGEYQDKYSQGLNGNYINGSIQGTASSQSYGARVDTLKSNGAPVQLYDPRDIFFKTGFTTDNNISVSGGTDKSKYLMSYSYLNNEGIIPTTSFTRNAFFGKFTNQISNNFSATVSINYVNTINHRTQEGNGLTNPLWGIYAAPITWNPLPSTWEDGTQRLYRSLSRNNPFYQLENSGFVSTVNRFLPTVNLTYSPAKWLTITERIGLDMYSDNARYHEDKTINGGVFGNQTGGISNRLQDYRQLNHDFIVSLQKDITPDLFGSISVGNNLLSNFSDTYVQSGIGLNIPRFYNISNTSTSIVSDYVSKYRKVGFYAQANLEYKKMLNLSLTGRYDGSSLLANDKQYYPYGSAGFGFVFSELMSKNNAFTFGKVRVSYSSVGNDNIPPYSTTTPYVLGGTVSINHVNFPYNGINGARLTNVQGNPNIKNENLNEFEIGTELKFLSNRLSFEGSYFNRESKDLLSQIPTNPSSGFLYAIRNVGSIQNTGYEFLLSGTPIKTKYFTWEASLNFTRIRSMVTSLGEGVDQVQLGGFGNAGVFLFKDQPYGILYGLGYERNEQRQIKVDDDGIPIPTTDFVAIGNVNPDFNAGLNNTFSYKGFSLNFLFDWKKGGDVLNLDANYMWFYGTSKVTEQGRETPFVVPNSVYATDGKANTTPVTAQAYWPAISGITESNIEDGTYLKLRTASFAYTLTPGARKLPFRSLTLSVGGNNLWIHAPHFTSGDPEANVAGGVNGQGVTNFQTPTVRSIIVGLKATF